MSATRRDILKSTAVIGVVSALGGCEKLISRATKQMGVDVPDTVNVPSGVDTDPGHHLLSRAGYGPWPGEVDQLKASTPEAWIDQQLSPESIDDTLCDLRARRFEELYQAAGECYEYKKPIIRQDLARHTLLRAVYSKRQLLEVMVGFWSDHLNVSIDKADCIYLKPWDDREVIRKHALGTFRDLIRASATSPAMLVYLDGNQNVRRKPGDVPNENYARELLELHTLGVHGGYSQKDVYEAARALTGWRVRTKWRRGTVEFEPNLHDDGAKTILGQTIPAGGGKADVDRLVDIVCKHPSTAKHVAEKLCRRFVSDDPPTALVDRVAKVFTDTGGQIKPMVREVLTSEEFKSARGTKFKQPFRFVVSALRAVGADTHAHTPLIEYLTRMGQGIFQHPTPDGYPDRTGPWLGTLLWRWNFAFSLASGQVPTVNAPVEKLAKAIGASGDNTADRLYRYFAGHDLPEAQRAALAEAGTDRTSLVAIILSSPGFQVY